MYHCAFPFFDDLVECLREKEQLCDFWDLLYNLLVLCQHGLHVSALVKFILIFLKFIPCLFG